MNNRKLTVSVGNLVDYAMKGGSIDFEYIGSSRAVEGIVLHQIIQKGREAEAALYGFTYEKEVRFKETFTALDIEITVQGRADGIMNKGGEIWIEEIKTTVKPYELINENITHLAQAKCYAYFYALSNNLEGAGVLLNYVNAQTYQRKEFEHLFTFSELKLFFNGILEEYAKWAKFIIDWKDIRNQSINELSFPYDGYRDGQREMSVSVYRTIERKKNIFINAPTGIGKTISALFPAVKSVGMGKADRIFYLTAKTVTRQAALSAVSLMGDNGLNSKTIVITAKEKICFLDKPACNPVSCEYANGHFYRINEALKDILERENICGKEIIEGYAKKHTVCPYEYSLDIALFSDIIICDYNYAFDKWVYLRRFFSEISENYVFLVDEAHNLVDRARDMYSADLSLRQLKKAIKGIGKEGREIKGILVKIRDDLIQLSEDITDEFYGTVFDSLPKSILRHARDFYQSADRWLAGNRDKAQTKSFETILDCYFLITRFLSVYQLFDDKFVCFCTNEGGDVLLKLLCADPGTCLRAMLKNAVASVFFSATLTPIAYFKELLGASRDDYAILLKSPFPEENLQVFVCGRVSTKYKNREKYHEIIADYMYAAISEKKGNYFAFFPSYAYLDSVYFQFASKYQDIKTIVQTPKMDESEKDSFLKGFDMERPCSYLAFAVLGGMFSEGIDLPGDKLIGAFVISVGLPQISFERFIISGYFNNKNGEGFEYAYIYPGMNKVMQAGGRVIRTMRDKGIIVLIDERFSQKGYRGLFPKSWLGWMEVVGVKDLAKAAKDFWEKGDR